MAVLCIGPLALLSYLTIDLAEQAVLREVNARVSTTSAVTAELVEQQMGGVADLTESYATRPVLIAAMADGDPRNFDDAALQQQLAQLQMSRPGIAAVFTTDMSCRLSHTEPPTPATVGVDFSFRDWCQGARTNDRAYVSEAYRTALVGRPLVVAVATTVRSGGTVGAGRPLGILAVVYTLDAINSYTDEVAEAQGVELSVTDQQATVLAGRAGRPAAVGLTSMADDSLVVEALAGRSGVSRSDRAGADTLSAFAPVRSLGWAVTAHVPSDAALAGAHRLRTAVIAIAGLLAVVLVAGLVLLARSLQHRREAELALAEREAATRAIIDAATDAFVSIDPTGTITAWNDRAVTTFGWTEAEAIGRPLADTIIPARLPDERDEGLARFLATGEGPQPEQRTTITAVHRDGHEFPAEVTMWPSRTGDAWTYNAFVQDITDRARFQADLAFARDEALAASQLKSEFLANMSHEIRTPMNGVLGMTSLLLETDLGTDQREFAETVQSSGEALLAILNDILDLSKIEAGRIDLESIDFDLRELVEDATTLLSLAAHGKGVEMACRMPTDRAMSLRGDPTRLRQVLTNLIGNAVKFTAAGEVVVAVTMTDGDGSTVAVRFEVIDTGIGIAGAAQSEMFESFSQADSATTRRYGGTGLGLTISRQLVELMGGEIGVESELGRGSTFWFTVPLQRAHTVVAAQPRASLIGRRILIVDDNATNRTILTRSFLAWGVHPHEVDGAVPAIEALTQAVVAGRPFDAAVLDFNMPDIDGIELARRITADPSLAPVQLVMLTSSGQGGEVGLARDAGIGGHLTKPVRLLQLYDVLARLLHAPVHVDPGQGRPPSAAVAPDRPSAAGARVLLAEDNIVNQRVATLMLEHLGCEVDVVADGAEAVAAATGTAYGLILMDCQMPVMDGYEATARIRALPGAPGRTPIVAITASVMAADQERARRAGMDDHLTKPIRSDALAAALERWAPDEATLASPAVVGPG